MEPTTTRPAFSLEYGRFRFQLQSRNKATLPSYKGSTLRGVLGRAFRQIACHGDRKDCEGCMFLTRCAYAYVFETNRFTVAQEVGQHYVSHPFLLEPEVDGREDYLPGDVLAFHLVLFGHGLDYLPYFILAFQKVESLGLGVGRHPFTLEKVEQSLDEGAVPIWQGGDSLLRPPQRQDLANYLEPDGNNSREELHLNLETPLRLVSGGEMVTGLEFAVLARALFRRLSYLGKAHGRVSLDLPFQDLLGKAGKVQQVESGLSWQDWERYSARQRKKLQMGGLVGSVRFQGPLQEFWPFLRMGEIIHLGKGTVFGLGKMRVTDWSE